MIKTVLKNCRRFLPPSYVLLLYFAAASCSKSDPELVGFGRYKLGKSTPADGYKCRPEGADTFCFLNPSPRIAGHKTQTDLYFRGHEEDAPLVEIRVGVWDCKPGEVEAALATRLGDATEVANKRAKWTLKRMTVIALLPKENHLCTIHFLDLSEEKRSAALFPGTSAASLEHSTDSPSTPGSSTPASSDSKSTKTH